MSIILSQDQEEVKNLAVEWYNKENKQYFIYTGLAGTGKEQPTDCLVQTPEGPKKIGDLSLGEEIFGSDGSIINVIGIYPQGLKQSYKVTFRDNTTTECGIDHLWAVNTVKTRANKRPPVVKTTREIFESGVKMKCGLYRYYIPLCKPLAYEKKKLSIHPYILGVFMADGSKLGNTPNLSVCNSDMEILETVSKLLPFKEMGISTRQKNGCTSSYFSDNLSYKKNRFAELFRDLSLNKKSIDRRIPEQYLMGSIEQRYSLLRGLMDTDGCNRNNRISYSTSSPGLANDIVNLVQSLGGIAILKKHVRKNKKNPEYSINIKTFKNPFFLRRKAKDWKLSWKNPPSRAIINIEKSRMVEQVCIRVSANDSLYLTDNHIVTHNSTILKPILRDIEKTNPGVRIAFVAYTGKAATVIKEKLKSDRYSVSTIHSLLYRPKLKDKVLVGWEMVPPSEINADLLIIDEGSMVTKEIWDDILKTEKRVLVLGDHGQLPPIGDGNFNLVKKYDIKLKKIHRQALDSPIIKLSLIARKNGKIPYGVFGKGVGKIKFHSDKGQEIIKSYTPSRQEQMICGMNKTRVDLNEMIRKNLGFEKSPKEGERIICIKNNKRTMIMNGHMGIIQDIELLTKHLYIAKVKMDCDYEMGSQLFPVYRKPFGKKDHSRYIANSYSSHLVAKTHYTTKDMMLFEYGNVISCHKCITGDTMVPLKDVGMVRLDSLDNGAEVGEFKELRDNIKIKTLDGWKQPTHFFNNGVDDIYEIKTKYGYSLKGTANHKVYTLTKNGIIKKEISDIREGDFITLSKMGSYGLGGKRLEMSTISPIKRARMYNLPKTNSVELSRFLGFIVADGCLTSSGISFAKRHPEVVVEFRKTVFELFGKYSKILKKKNFDICYISSKYIKSFCENIDGLSPNNKFVPNMIFESSKEEQLSFLKAIFEDGTVNLKNGKVDHIEISIKSPKMADQIHMLLLNNGIISTKRPLKGLVYITIYGENISIFAKNIGFFSHFKQNRLSSYICHGKSNKNSIPFIGEKIFEFMEKNNLPFDKKLNNIRRNWRVTPLIISYFLDKYKSLDSDELYKEIASTTKYIFEKVESVDMIGREKTYCLTVPNGNNFVQNGINGGNSQGSEFEKVILVEERNPFQTDKEWSQWLYTAITRASKYIIILGDY